jgi:hypothetical protein
MNIDILPMMEFERFRNARVRAMSSRRRRWRPSPVSVRSEETRFFCAMMVEASTTIMMAGYTRTKYGETSERYAT